MTRRFTLTLDTDGTSDRWLLEPIRRVAEEELLGTGVDLVTRAHWRGGTLTARLRQALRAYPCDVLVVHRDTEKPGLVERRAEEIDAAVHELSIDPLVVRLIPERMSEAWLLMDERAIRAAAGNPNGAEDLGIPPVAKLESCDAKSVLDAALVRASGFARKKRRRQQFERRFAQNRQRVAQLVEDYGVLRELEPYRRFEEELRGALRRLVSHSRLS